MEDAIETLGKQTQFSKWEKFFSPGRRLSNSVTKAGERLAGLVRTIVSFVGRQNHYDPYLNTLLSLSFPCSQWRPTPWWRYDDSRSNRWQKLSSVAVGVGGAKYSFYSLQNFGGKCKEEEIRGTFQLVQMSMTSAQLPVTSLQRFLTSLQLSMKSSTAVHNNLFKNDFGFEYLCPRTGRTRVWSRCSIAAML